MGLLKSPEILTKSELHNFNALVDALAMNGYAVLGIHTTWESDYYTIHLNDADEVEEFKDALRRRIELTIAHNNEERSILLKPSPSGFNFFGTAVDIVNLFNSKEA